MEEGGGRTEGQVVGQNLGEGGGRGNGGDQDQRYMREHMGV